MTLWPQVRLKTVDSYSTKDDGVWHPDSMELCLAYRGSGNGAADGALAGSWFSPWAAVDKRATVDAFTEGLPAEAEALQWCLPLYEPVDAARGNWAISRQDGRPTWLSKPAFLAFGALRSYPLRQGRALCATLHERVLPLEQPAVQTLVRQTAFHLGELTDSAAPALLWRSEWEGGEGGVLATLHAELAKLAADFQGASRMADAVALLGELAAYLSGWRPELRGVARSFAGAAESWADGLEDMARQAPPDTSRPLRAKQCVLRCIALLCHASGPLNADDVGSLLGLAVQTHHGAIYGSGTELEGRLAELQVCPAAVPTRALNSPPEHALQRQPCSCGDPGQPLNRLQPMQQNQSAACLPACLPALACLQVLCHWALSRRIDVVLATVGERPAILTAALRRVLGRAPADLSWERLPLDSSASASFHAKGGDGVLYSLNCLDGTVLEDGAPPGRLPRQAAAVRGGSRLVRCAVNGMPCCPSVRPAAGRFWTTLCTSAALARGALRSPPPPRACAAPLHPSLGASTSSGWALGGTWLFRRWRQAATTACPSAACSC